MELFRIFGSVFLNDREAREGLREIDQQAQQTADRFTQMGSTMTTAGGIMTGAIGLVGGSLIKMASDSESANAKLQASLGLTAEETEKLSEVGHNIYKQGFGESLEEVNQALITTKTNIQGLNEADLQTITQEAMSFQQLFEEDITASTATASVMMKQFGINSQTAFDLMTYGMQKGGNFSGELLDTLREYSPQFKDMGMNAEQMMGILIKGAEAGAFNLDKVGDAVKEFNLRAQDGSKSTAEGFQAIKLDAEKMGQAIAEGGEKGQQAFVATVSALANMKDEVARNQAGAALFGTQWEDVRSKVVVAMAEGVKGIQGFEGASQQASETLQDTFGERLQSSLRSAQEQLLPLANTLLDLAEKYLPPLISSVEKAINFFTNLPEPVQKGILIFTGLMAVLAPLLVVFGSLASGIGAIIPLFASGGALAGVFGGAIAALTGPIGIAIAIFAALVAAGVAIYKNWDEIKAYASKVWNEITTIFTNFWNTAKSTFSSAMESIKQLFTSYFEAYKSIVVGVFEGIVSVIRTYFNVAYTVIGAIFKTIKAIFTGDLGSIKTIWLDAWTKITGVVGGAKDTILGIVDTITQKISGVISTISNAVGKAKEFLGLGGGGSVPMPRYAKGTDFHQGGLAVVGERGREIVNLPRGSQVIPNNETESILSGGKGITQNITINSVSSLSPYETSRKMKQAAQQLALEWGV